MISTPIFNNKNITPTKLHNLIPPPHPPPPQKKYSHPLHKKNNQPSTKTIFLTPHLSRKKCDLKKNPPAPFIKIYNLIQPNPKIYSSLPRKKNPLNTPPPHPKKYYGLLRFSCFKNHKNITFFIVDICLLTLFRT